MTHAATLQEVRVAVDHANDFLAEDTTLHNLTHIERDSLNVIRDMAERINKLVEALETALVDIKDIVGMSPELDDPRLTLYRFDDVDMDTVKHAHEALRQALADYRGTTSGDAQ